MPVPLWKQLAREASHRFKGGRCHSTLRLVTFDAVNRSYEVVIPRDAVTGTPLDYVDQVFAHTLGYVATVTDTDAVVAAWSS